MLFSQDPRGQIVSRVLLKDRDDGLQDDWAARTAPTVERDMAGYAVVSIDLIIVEETQSHFILFHTSSTIIYP